MGNIYYDDKGREFDKRIMRLIPKSKQEGISSAFHDDDGYWIWLKDGWNADRMDVVCHVIHEDTIAQLRYQIGGIRKCQ